MFNQMTESLSVADIAATVAKSYPGEVTVHNLDNPRVEKEEHYYKVVHSGLVELGLEPHLLSDTLITSLFDVAKRYSDRVDLNAMQPRVNWRGALDGVTR
ncbi:hypothetical protein ACFQYP_14420 [Nonomuraea antimicrobica]